MILRLCFIFAVFKYSIQADILLYFLTLFQIILFLLYRDVYKRQIGFYAFGAAALGSKLAIGAAAVGGTAIGKEAQGTYVLLLDEIYSRDQVRQFLVEHVPGIWKPFLEIICSFFHQTPK